jgi:hypothetical protein
VRIIGKPSHEWKEALWIDTHYVINGANGQRRMIDMHIVFINSRVLAKVVVKSFVRPTTMYSMAIYVGPAGVSTSVMEL